MVSLIVLVDKWEKPEVEILKFEKTFYSILSQYGDVIEMICVFENDEYYIRHLEDLSYAAELNINNYILKNSTAVQKLNYGIAKAKGDILGYISSGSILFPERIFLQSSNFQKIPMWSFSGFATIEDKKMNYFMGDQFFGQFCDVRNNASMAEAIITRFPKSCFVNGDSVLFNREMIDKVGIFDERLELTFNYDMWIRMSYISEPFLIMQPLILQFEGSKVDDDKKKSELKIINSKIVKYASGEF